MCKKFNDFKTDDYEGNKPSSLIQDFIEFGGVGNFEAWLKTFEFDSREEIYAAVKKYVISSLKDGCITQKYNRDNSMNLRYIYAQNDSLMNKVNALEKYATSLSGELWGNHFARYKLNKNVNELFSNKPNKDIFLKAKAQIQDVWRFTDFDMEKFLFFVLMVRDDDFPPSLRRLIYVWGDRKFTGKTTLARTIVAILNGDKSSDGAEKYESTLTAEMQVEAYSVPKIASANAIIMDEMFYHDMSKTYNKFKSFITSKNGTSRLPYGQTFQWFGNPNYFATANDPLETFIKDMSDRRYLEVHIQGKPKQLTFEAIYDVWKDFITNAQFPEKYKDWKEWVDEIAPLAEVKGEKSTIVDEFEMMLKSSELVQDLQAKFSNNEANRVARTANDNRITLLYFIKFFRDRNIDVLKKRNEIDIAAQRVFGEKENVSGKHMNYWLLGNIIERIEVVNYDNQGLSKEIRVPETVPF